MTLIRVSLMGALLLLAGCGQSPEPSDATQLSTEQQAEIEKLKEAYSKSGRGGPGGQKSPPKMVKGEEGSSAP